MWPQSWKGEIHFGWNVSSKFFGVFAASVSDIAKCVMCDASPFSCNTFHCDSIHCSTVQIVENSCLRCELVKISGCKNFIILSLPLKGYCDQVYLEKVQLQFCRTSVQLRVLVIRGLKLRKYFVEKSSQVTMLINVEITLNVLVLTMLNNTMLHLAHGKGYFPSKLGE